MNIRKLRKLQRFIQRVPERFTMHDGLRTLMDWHSRAQFISSTKLLKIPKCKTAGCLAGETLMMTETASQLAKRINDDDGWISWVNLKPKAADILGLSDPQADRLFILPRQDHANTGQHWPTRFVRAYAKAKTPKQRVKVAVEYIDFFIKDEQEREKLLGQRV